MGEIFFLEILNTIFWNSLYSILSKNSLENFQIIQTSNFKDIVFVG